MLAEQVVEECVLRAGVVVAVPPKPIASLGDVDFVPGAVERGTRSAECGTVRPFRTPRSAFRAADELRALPQVLASAVQRVPGGVVLLVADPDREIVMDPTAGKQVR